VPAPHHRPSPLSPVIGTHPGAWSLTSAAACSTISLVCPTPGSGAADGIHWSARSASRCAVLAGARSLAAIGEWVAAAPCHVLAALGVRRDPWTGVWRPPGEATVRRVLARVDADALDAALGRWLADQQPPPPTTRPPPAPRSAWRRSRSTARPCAAAGTTPTRRCTSGGDGPHQPWGPGPGRRGRHYQRDHPVPAPAGRAGPCRARGDRRRVIPTSG
jgi:DDE_Tnp_1-associated